MLASINWLKKYVDIDVTPEELADKLTHVGLEVERVIHLGEGLEGVITGKVQTIERHPNSDHLWICQMDLGNGELTQILTGAQNVHQYDMVPVAVVGSHLPNGMKLKTAKLRGLDSFGMLCSAGELGIDSKLLLPEQRDGIFILPPDTPIGVDVRSFLGLDDVVLDIDLTTNRGDCFNMLGLAREVGVVLNKPVTLPEMAPEEGEGTPVENLAKVSIEADDLCSRFSLRMVKNLKIQPSPEWMQKLLRAVNIRPINNVVDVTNYVMMELGQPMHAYDYDKVTNHHWVVRRANEGEVLKTLDSQDRNLTEEMIVIGDDEKGIGLGGIMGGFETEVTDATKTVMLESATFDGPTIRRTSKALGLRSEASQRFERGVDTIRQKDALDRAVYLIVQMGAGEAVPGVTEAYPHPQKPVVIDAVPEKLDQRIGCDIPVPEMKKILEDLYFTVEEKADGSWSVTVPTWRKDCDCSADLSEEIARIYGYDKIPSKTPQLDMARGGQSGIEDLKDTVRDTLVGEGLDEVMTYTFVNQQVFDNMALPAADPRRKAIQIINPISEDFRTMRTTIVPSLLNTVAYNLARQQERVAIFEVGRVFIAKDLPLTEFPEEREVLGIALSGKRHCMSWNESKDTVDFYDVKGYFESVMDKLQVTDIDYKPCTEPFMHPGKSCVILYKGEKVGFMGAIHPTSQERFGLSQETYVLELSLKPFVEAAEKVPQFVHIPQFPSVSRDIAVVVNKDVPAAALEEDIRTQCGTLLKEVRLFDVYTGLQVKPGCKSVAFNLTFQDLKRTLQDKEVDDIIKQVVEHVQERFGGSLRD
ncbi:MAG: phenylalanine--tRNA ligase subunit beta [Acidaminococcus sp.]|jgi:phenylalanyl-tRNA synthetase beta chain|nr:phenylalanine--tRNA ligase subunit beta [Acidaminococcus sp.]MCI2099825.1 phenylalanine--tRNA ligase subunit beta [Acidaminococcus sp.]MCI2114053.1 phenylalanine--tRNA ligase subunit beta [Acidaminococcus sp.]MCI2115923.1 phenylalanine--tRNA ligase subunit beta [Acidaminococcus sp.]